MCSASHTQAQSAARKHGPDRAERETGNEKVIPVGTCAGLNQKSSRARSFTCWQDRASEQVSQCVSSESASLIARSLACQPARDARVRCATCASCTKGKKRARARLRRSIVPARGARCGHEFVPRVCICAPLRAIYARVLAIAQRGVRSE